MNNNLPVEKILRKAADFYQIEWDEIDNCKYIHIDGYYFDEGQDNGKGTSRLVQYCWFRLSLEEFIKQRDEKEDWYDDIQSECKQYWEDMETEEAYDSMKCHFGDKEEIKFLRFEEIDVDSPLGCYVNM